MRLQDILMHRRVEWWIRQHHALERCMCYEPFHCNQLILLALTFQNSRIAFRKQLCCCFPVFYWSGFWSWCFCCSCPYEWAQKCYGIGWSYSPRCCFSWLSCCYGSQSASRTGKTVFFVCYVEQLFPQNNQVVLSMQQAIATGPTVGVLGDSVSGRLGAGHLLLHGTRCEVHKQIRFPTITEPFHSGYRPAGNIPALYPYSLLADDIAHRVCAWS